mgnify:CR=1 FL=1
MTYIIYDFETSGRSARFDQVLQAGFIVYDQSFTPINKINIKSKLNIDVIPSIGALRVNKLLIKDLFNEKFTYYEMILEIENFLKKFENAFFLGFNSINFDEEFFRQARWEHFLYPYLTNTNGNFRGDLFNFATMIHAFRNKSINVGKNENGKLTFKLESLAQANSFNIKNSHEAIADVEATMKLMELLSKKNHDLFKVFVENSRTKNVEKKISEKKVFTLHNYLFRAHRIYLVKSLINHPIYKNQHLGFDLKYNSQEIVDLEKNELKEVYLNKSFFRKIKLNKQPSILDKSFAKKSLPYSEISESEIDLKCKQLEKRSFLENLAQILEDEAIDKMENQSQEIQHEEDTIYSKNLNFKDSCMMINFHKESWSKKWSFAEKFIDPRLRFFAAKHLYRNAPDNLPRKIFLHLHEKISDRLNSMKKESFTTIPSAMEEADSLSLEIEEKLANYDEGIKNQLEQYNIYINLLNDYYNDSGARPMKFDSDLSKKLFS